MTVEEGKLIYTLGTSTRSRAEFVDLLLGHGVELVVDVSRFPSSKFEHFCRDNLETMLRDSGIDYLHMGEDLGGYRRGGYEGFTAAPEFQAGLSRLEEVARDRRTAIVCAERFPWRCHRRFIARELEKRGWQVIHMIDPGRDWAPQKAEVPRI